MQYLNFYSPLKQKKHEQALFHIAQTQCNSSSTSDFTGTAWDLVRSSEIDTQTDETCTGMGSLILMILCYRSVFTLGGKD